MLCYRSLSRDHSASMIAIVCSALFLIIGLSATSFALPSKSQIFYKSGQTQLEEAIPWFSGWRLNGEALNLSQLLDEGKINGTRGYLLLLCSTQCLDCREGLRMINTAREKLSQNRIQLIVGFLEDIDGHSLKGWLVQQMMISDDQLKASPIRAVLQKNRLKRIGKSKKRRDKKSSIKNDLAALEPIYFIDRYLTLAKRFGVEGIPPPKEEVSGGESGGEKEEEDLEEETPNVRELEPLLPRSFLFNEQGVVIQIVGREGYDFIEKVQRTLNTNQPL